MKHFCFFCVTYEKDYEEFKRMIESFKRHNVEGIPFIIALQDPMHSSLGNHFIDLLDFRGLTDSSLVNPLKSSKNSKSTTANIRMLEGGGNLMETMESKLVSGADSPLDSKNSNVESGLDSSVDSKDSIKEDSNYLDSTQSVESNKINSHEAKRSATLKACSGNKGVVKSGVGANALPLVTTPFSPFECERVESDKFVENSNEALESNLYSKNSNLDSRLDSKDSTDSTLCVESNKINSVCGTHPLKASSGERESVREGEGSDFASACSCKVKRSKIQAPSPSLENGRLENSSLVEDSKELENSLKDHLGVSKGLTDSNNKSTLVSNKLEDSKNLVKSTLDSRDSKKIEDSNTESIKDSNNLADSTNILLKFKAFEDENIKVILDTSFAKEHLIYKKSEILPFSIGYINQEIAKLSFFEYGEYEHYLCIDSDSIFIRDFRKSDFFYNNDTPYISLMQDRELHVSPHYRAFAAPRKEYIKKIFDFLDLRDTRYRTCHNSQIISTIIMQSFKKEILEKKGLSYLDILEIAPLEFSWYSAYFQKCGLIKEMAIEGFLKMYHTKTQYLLDKISGLKMEDLKEEYIGVIMNSNWAKDGIKKPSIIDRILFLLIRKLC